MENFEPTRIKASIDHFLFSTLTKSIPDAFLVSCYSLSPFIDHDKKAVFFEIRTNLEYGFLRLMGIIMAHFGQFYYPDDECDKMDPKSLSSKVCF